MNLKWKREISSVREPFTPGSYQSPFSHGGDSHHYIILHRPDWHTVLYRPPGEIEQRLGSFMSEEGAKLAAERHSKGMPVFQKRSAERLDREIAEALTEALTKKRLSRK